MSTPTSTRTQPHEPRAQRSRGLLDTSVLIDLEDIALDALPRRAAVSTISLAELAAGPYATDDPEERSRRQARLSRIEREATILPFDQPAARAYGEVYGAVTAAGRKARGRRALDLLIAATARGNRLPLYTRNPDDFKELTGLVEVIAVPDPASDPEDD